MELHTFERIEYGRCAAARSAGGEIEAHLAQAGAAPRRTFSPLDCREPVWQAGDTVRVVVAVALLLACFAADLHDEPAPAEHVTAAETTAVTIAAVFGPSAAPGRR